MYSKITFENRSYIKIFFDKHKLGEFIISRSALKEIKKVILW